MKEERLSQKIILKWPLLKRSFLIVLLIAAMVLLSGCIVDPDRTVDQGNDLTGNVPNQTYDTALPNNTPVATVTPTQAPVSTASNWEDWNFVGSTATDPPSNFIQVGPTDSLMPGQTQSFSSPGMFTPTPGPSTSTQPNQGTPSSETLRTGSEGPLVRQLQEKLKDLGYYNGVADGKFGSGTESAVKAFQSANQLSSDGIAGKATQESIYSPFAKKKSSSTASSGNNSGNSSGTTSSTKTSSPTRTPAPTQRIDQNTYQNGRTDIYLQLGSNNKAQVKIMQNRLIVLGYLSGTADGDFQATTEAAVLAFQKRNSIYADGVAGPTTLTKLYSSSAKKASEVVAILGSIKRGMNGGAVRSLQTKLKELGYYNGTIDGDYGEGTEAAVIAFQAANNLKPDGIAGSSTQNAIFGGGNSPTLTNQPNNDRTSADNYGKSAKTNGYSTISAASTNKNNITALQSVLQSKSYYSGSLDGSYGSGTQDAVTSYQKSVGLRPTGMAGPSTQRLLYGGTSESGSYSKLKPGSTGSPVKDLQYTLYELKYYDGNITGTYDKATENAVMNFQQVNGLSVDGVAGQDTQRRLYSSNAIPSNI